MTKYKKPFHNTAREDLLSIGAYISSHLTEGWYSIFWMCFYVYVSVTLHVPIFSLVWSLIVEHADLDLGDDVHQVIDYAVSHIDAHLYVFLAVLLALVHRLVSPQHGIGNKVSPTGPTTGWTSWRNINVSTSPPATSPSTHQPTGQPSKQPSNQSPTPAQTHPHARTHPPTPTHAPTHPPSHPTHPLHPT